MTLGPADPSVLYLQETHISNDVSTENTDTILRVKRTDNLIWGLYNENVIHSRVLQCLNYMGLYGVLLCGYRIIDNHLITALVERWRRETHTFHFRTGEATITLQDISIIWGLKIDGEPVIGIDYSFTVQHWQQVCDEFLGFQPSPSHFKGSHLSMAAIAEHCDQNRVTQMSSEAEVIQYVRCIAMMVIGGIMFPDYQGGSVRLMYLQLLIEIDTVSSYSWGSAVLAFLYRELCNATRIGKAIIAGPLYILQIWAWSRIKCINPDRLGATLNVAATDPDQILAVAPYGARWNVVFSHTHTATHAVRIIRHMFDCMRADEFNWTVYEAAAADVNSITSAYNIDIWRSVCPLICFEIVEMHRPNRVMRQFNMRQAIPIPAFDGDDLHNTTRIGHRNKNWREYHQNAIALWEQRYALIAHGELHDGCRQTDQNYRQWYEQITVHIISPPISGVGFRPHAFPYPPQQGTQPRFTTTSPFSHQSAGGYDEAGPSNYQNTSGSGFGNRPSYAYTTNISSNEYLLGRSTMTPVPFHGYATSGSVYRPQEPVTPTTIGQPNLQNEPNIDLEQMGEPDRVPPRRGDRRRRRPRCGTGGHLI